jgi:hypothetical protein
MARDETITIPDFNNHMCPTKTEEADLSPLAQLAENKSALVIICAFKEKVVRLLKDVKNRCDHYHEES